MSHEFPLSTRQVHHLLGLTERQLYYWVEQGWIPGLSSPGSGSLLRWRPDHIERARQIGDAIEHLVKLTGPGMLNRHAGSRAPAQGTRALRPR